MIPLDKVSSADPAPPPPPPPPSPHLQYIPFHLLISSLSSYLLTFVLQFKKLSGTNFLYTRTGDSGKPINYTNCGKCGTIMTADVQALEGVVLVKGGTVDDLTLDAKLAPKVEIYRKTAPEWCTPVAGAALKEVS